MACWVTNLCFLHWNDGVLAAVCIIICINTLIQLATVEVDLSVCVCVCVWCVCVCVCVCVHACVCACIQMSLSGGSRGGFKVTCFKYRQCHDKMLRSTYKAHLHNILLHFFHSLSLSLYTRRTRVHSILLHYSHAECRKWHL